METNRRTTMTKRILKETLIELLETKPINHISVRELCEVADLNRSTFYAHYTDQYALLDEIQKEAINQTIYYLSDVSSNILSIEYIEKFLSYIKDNQSVFKILLLQKGTFDFEDQFSKAVLNKIYPNIPLKSKSNEQDYVYSYMMSGCLTIIKKWLSEGCKTSINKLSKLIFSLCHVITTSTIE